MDSSLRVEPDALGAGARQIRETHEALRAVLAKIDSGHDSLRNHWTGGAAAKGTTMWSDLRDAFGAHVDQLTDNADDLHTAAKAYRDRDGEARANIDRQM